LRESVWSIRAPEYESQYFAGLEAECLTQTDDSAVLAISTGIVGRGGY
jgi:hypothetical protein